MKKYYCPYCGEPTFSNYQKYTGKDYGIGAFIRNTIFFNCPHCHREIERRSTLQGKKILKYLIPIYLILAFALVVLLIAKMYIFVFILLLFMILFSFALTLISGKNCVLTRLDGDYNDILFPVEIDSKEITSGSVYMLKPTSNELNKVNIHREYIAEITNDNLNKYFVRVIKPIDCTFAPTEFLIYDDKKCVGNGKLLV